MVIFHSYVSLPEGMLGDEIALLAPHPDHQDPGADWVQQHGEAPRRLWTT